MSAPASIALRDAVRMPSLGAGVNWKPEWNCTTTTSAPSARSRCTSAASVVAVVQSRPAVATARHPVLQLGEDLGHGDRRPQLGRARSRDSVGSIRWYSSQISRATRSACGKYPGSPGCAEPESRGLELPRLERAHVVGRCLATFGAGSR